MKKFVVVGVVISMEEMNILASLIGRDEYSCIINWKR